MLVTVPVHGTFCIAVGYLESCCGTDMSMGQGMEHLYKHRLIAGAVQARGERAGGRAESSLLVSIEAMRERTGS